MAKRPWLLFLFIFIITFLFFIAIYIVDKSGLSSGHFENGWLDWVLLDDPQTAQNVLGSIAEVMSAVLAIAITVVAIIVQLAANRYTSKIIDLFINNLLNVVILSFFVITCVYGIWITNSIEISSSNSPLIRFADDAVFFPRIGISIYLAFTTISFFILVPYFYYVFQFLEPQKIIEGIEKQVNKVINKVVSPENDQRTAIFEKIGQLSDKELENKIFEAGVYKKIQDDFIENIEQISDIAMHSFASSDQSLGLKCIDTLAKITRFSYLERKSQLPSEWFIIHRDHFLESDRDVHFEIVRNGFWVEMKIVQQYESMLNYCLCNEQSFTNAISMRLHSIAVQAFMLRSEAKGMETLELLLDYFNTFLRLSIDKNSAHSTMDIFYHYRHLAEEMIDNASPADLIIKIAGYFKKYGQLAALKEMSILLETAAYDLRILIEKAFHFNHESHSSLLEIFLSVDTSPEKEKEMPTLRGIRKNQVILASFYLLKKQDLQHENEQLNHKEKQYQPEIFAKTIFNHIREEMNREFKDRQACNKELMSIKDEILNVKRKRYSEITARLNAFYFIDEEQQEKLEEFFCWFEENI